MEAVVLSVGTDVELVRQETVMSSQERSYLTQTIKREVNQDLQTHSL